MTRTFSFLFLFLFLASCGGGGGGSSTPGASSAEVSDAELVSGQVPVEAQTFDINAQVTGFDRDNEDKIHRAFDLIKKVIASDEFKQRVLNKTYNGRKQYVDNDGLSNAQIYQKILLASENLNQGNNNTMDISIQSYFDPSNVIGYTKPNINTIYVNTKFLSDSSFGVNQVAMNITHEWLHKIGFKHAFERTPNRDQSVPYAIGYIMRDLAAKFQ